MSTQDDNKAVVGRWFTEFWGKDVNRGRRRDALAAFVTLAAIQFAIKRLARM
jgi:hypothetical protein